MCSAVAERVYCSSFAPRRLLEFSTVDRGHNATMSIAVGSKYHHVIITRVGPFLPILPTIGPSGSLDVGPRAPEVLLTVLCNSLRHNFKILY